MPRKYLFTTPDGEDIHVEASQAGEIIETPKGNKVELPTLRGLKYLPVIEDDTAPESKWAQGQSIMFVVGFGMLLVGGGLLYFLLSGAPPTTEEEVMISDVQIDRTVDTYGMDEMITMWNFSNDERALNTLRTRAEGRRRYLGMLIRWRVFVGFASGSILIGLVLMGVSVAMPRQKFD